MYPARRNGLGVLRTALIAVCIAFVLVGAVAPAAVFAQDDGGAGPQAKARSCIPLYDWDTTECLIVPFVSWMGGLILSLGAFILMLAGTLFDVLLSHIIVDFRGSLNYLGITNAIDIGWSVFRDLANVLMIWMFVFIAISIILGVQEFGQKKHVAKVLIIAVLINFSLLFTKIIIDASNFVAYQIYNQVAGQEVDGKSFDMAMGFLKPMGITGIGDSQKMLTKNFNTKTIGGAAQIFLFSIIGFILLIGIALTFLYGCFLILARAILLIILMLTSAVAFASYLIPHFSEGEYGWKNWWKTLINVSVFAPLLMLLLWISMLIVQSAGVKRAGTLGSMLADPASQLTGNGWTIIMIYLLTIGLLVMSFKISHAVAGSISGFNLASALAASPITLGSRFIAAPFGRQVFGRAAYRGADKLGKEGKELRFDATTYRGQHDAALRKSKEMYDKGNKELGKKYELQALDFKKKALSADAAAAEKMKEKALRDKIADRKFNVMDTTGGKKLAKGLNLKGLASGETPKETKSLKGNIDEQAKAAAKTAEGLSVSKEDRDRVRREGEAEAARQFDEAKRTREAIHAGAQETAAAIREARDTEHKELTRQEADAKTEVHTVEKEVVTKKEEISQKHDSQIADIDRVITAKLANKEDVSGLQSERSKIQAQKQSAIEAEDNRIKAANSRVSTIQSQMADLDKKKYTAPDGRQMSTQEALAAAAQAKEGFDKYSDDKFREEEIQRLAQPIIKSKNASLDESASGAVEQVARQHGNVVQRVVNRVTQDDKLIVAAAKKQFKGNQEEGRIKKVLKDFVGGEAKPPAAASEPKKEEH